MPSGLQRPHRAFCCSEYRIRLLLSAWSEVLLKHFMIYLTIKAWLVRKCAAGVCFVLVCQVFLPFIILKLRLVWFIVQCQTPAVDCWGLVPKQLHHMKLLFLQSAILFCNFPFLSVPAMLVWSHFALLCFHMSITSSSISLTETLLYASNYYCGVATT